MKSAAASLFSSFLLLGILAVAPAAPSFGQKPAADPSSPAGSVGLFVYPQKQQSPARQSQDETECYASAKQNSGVDPTAPPPPPEKADAQPQGAGAKGAARGAAGGAALGAITGDAGTGAAVGATAGAVRGRRSQRKAEKAAEQQAQASAKQQQGQRLDAFRRAMSACLDARGYSVK